MCLLKFSGFCDVTSRVALFEPHEDVRVTRALPPPSRLALHLGRITQVIRLAPHLADRLLRDRRRLGSLSQSVWFDEFDKLGPELIDRRKVIRNMFLKGF